MEKNQVAAVVVTYNRLPLLQKCIKSLYAQTAACDILVVNNASTDDTEQWLEKQEKAHILTTEHGFKSRRRGRIQFRDALGGGGRVSVPLAHG